MSHPMLLVTDLDGMLVRERDVDPRDARALLRWQEAGNLLAVATGRSVTLARLAVADASAAAEVALRPDFVICASGTTLLDADGQVLRSQTIPPREVTRAVEYLSTRQDCAVVVTTLEGDYLLHNPFAGREDSFNRFAASFYTTIPAQDAAGLAVTSMPVRVPDDALADALAAELERRSGGAISVPRSIQYLDLVPAGQDKGAAVRHLRQVLAERGVTLSRTVAVGDSWNDIPMFAVADHAYAMADGAAGARRAALEGGGSLTQGLADVVDREL